MQMIEQPLPTTIPVASPQQLENVMAELHDRGVTDADIHVDRSHGNDIELPDADLGTAIMKGLLVGPPVMFVVVMVMALLAGTTAAQAVGIAPLPAAFCGPPIVGFGVLMSRLVRLERAAGGMRGLEPIRVVVTGEHAAEAKMLVDEGQAAEAA